MDAATRQRAAPVPALVTPAMLGSGLEALRPAGDATPPAGGPFAGIRIRLVAAPGIQDADAGRPHARP